MIFEGTCLGEHWVRIVALMFLTHCWRLGMLLRAFHRDEAHGWAGDRFTNGGGVSYIVLAAFTISEKTRSSMLVILSSAISNFFLEQVFCDLSQRVH